MLWCALSVCVCDATGLGHHYFKQKGGQTMSTIAQIIEEATQNKTKKLELCTVDSSDVPNVPKKQKKKQKKKG